MREGFTIEFSDKSDVSIIPDDFSKECSARIGGFLLKIKADALAFEIEHDETTPRSEQIFIKSLKKQSFADAPAKPSGCSCGPTETGDVGTLGCRVKNCCCNCGGGWIC
ncbi:hypothetical protein HW571_21410 [Agrobacterium genomosp. 3]|uniref:hypothetical protein n=1 Tax=Agrobacterium tomkonis TaxID=1183410 RepID=UPI001CD88A78|nr:hypothetical protein [Agrobacterium tomkonis]MCA1878589.1 hypothetical protein [Agrobacterium tumefaciens]MCA1893814.1 hypothetical protein [Agrobacterium tomkonis]